MRTMMKRSPALAVAACLLAACQTAKINPTAGGGGLDGSWKPVTGGYVAQFDNGVFSTTALDTGNVISKGGYVAISEKEVDLNWTSNITAETNTAKCMRPDPDTLSCTDAGGKPFVLQRS